MKLRIDPELRAILPPLTPDERAGLEASLRAEGCRNKLVVWNGVLVDGHNRHDICTKHGIPFQVESRGFADRAAAVAWMVANQLGQRNLTPLQISYLRGKRYEAEKREHGGDRKSSAQNDPLKDDRPRTSEKLATEYGVSEATIRRDAEFSTAVDRVASKGGEQAKVLALSGKIDKGEVKALSHRRPAEIKATTEKAMQTKGRMTLGGKGKRRRDRTELGKKRIESGRNQPGGISIESLKSLFLAAAAAVQDEFVEWAVQKVTAR